MRQHKLFLILLEIFTATLLFAGEVKYPVSEIPDSLLKNAKSVMRKNMLEFTLENLNKTRTHIMKVITVLDRNADHYATKIFNYSNESSITGINAVIYDKDGYIIKKISRKDFKDINYDSYGSLYDDTRTLYLQSGSTEYPYTIEYDVTITKNHSYSFPDWFPIEYYNQSLEQGILSISVPVDYKINYKEQSISTHTSIKVEGDRRLYIWELNNIAAIDYEPYAPPFYEILPLIRVSPTNFYYGNYRGNMATWNDFGRFIDELNSGRDNISEELEMKITDLVSGTNDLIEKAKIVYDYLQSNTRYVSIQVGIGGIQTFPASIVEKYGYGDCKALSNYMKALLKVAGVDSYTALVESGAYEYNFDTSFVHDPFDHVILYIPNGKNQVWLECTNQMMPFGFLGDFTDNRYALVVTDNGGKLIKTTDYAGAKSTMVRNAEVYIDDNGKAEAIVNTIYTGLYYDDIMGLLHRDYERQKDYLYDKHIDIPDFVLKSFKFIDQPKMNPSVNELLELGLINYVKVSGTRLFIPINLMNRFDNVPRKNEERKNPIRILRDENETDTIWYHLPEGYNIEHMPEEQSLHNDFGTFEVSFFTLPNKIGYVRNYQINSGQYPKEIYNKFVTFLRAINKADKQKLILVKQSAE